MSNRDKSKGFAVENQTQVLRYANELAQKSEFRQIIKPIKNWRRSCTIKTISEFDLVSLGVLTAPEACVIQAMRGFYIAQHQLLKLNIHVLMATIADRIGVDDIKTVKAILQEPAARKQAIDEHGITQDDLLGWEKTLKDITSKYNLKLEMSALQQNLVTFILAMRHDPTWDYEDTAQLSPAEISEFIDFIRDEESSGVPDIELPEETSVKKP